jgi:3-methylcrotonyl-CoA carboxylase alpha subunit
VDKAEDFASALLSCQREAKASFGDDHVLIERYVLKPRHIEIQVFADTQGHCIYLFERDCSVQRRHQKVLEEAPAPGLSPERRAQMGAAAVAAAKAVGYVGAGTVEFIAEELDASAAAPGGTGRGGDLRFYFMEMNTRLQVEHPVTEAITGLDLVEWQLRVAAGQPLPLRQEQLTMRGHAIEARICAENPDANFLPATGTLQVARWPRHVAFERSDSLPRVDGGFAEGDAISPHYDSMIAKLIVWGETRAQALSRLDAALRDTHLMGLHTNVAFLRRVVTSHAFATADLDTALIERERAALFETPGLPQHVAAAAVAAHVLAAEVALEDTDPWSKRDGWRLHGGAHRVLSLDVQGTPLSVVIERLHDGATVLQIGQERWPFRTTALGNDQHDLKLGTQRLTVTVHARSHQNSDQGADRFAVFAHSGSALVAAFDPLAHAGDGAAEAGRLTAPMPGKVVSFLATVGQAVKRGDAVAVMEAMKMEHTLHAPQDGVVAELLYAVGDQVAEGGELLRLGSA